MTLFVDDPKLLTCFEGIKTLPHSEVPTLWSRLVAFDDSITCLLPRHSFDDPRPLMNHISVDSLVNVAPGWQHYLYYLKDAGEDPIHKTVYLCAEFAWYQLHVSQPPSDFNKTTIMILPLEAGIFEGFKHEDIIACPSECSVKIQVEVNYWLQARDKAKDIEYQVDLSLKPYPLSNEELIDRLVDELRLLVQPPPTDDR